MSSLVAMALRVTARKALNGETFAGSRVHDSAIDPIDHMVGQGEAEPFIVISSEDEKSKITGRDVNCGERTIDLVFEVAIAQSVSAMPDQEGEDPPAPEIVIPSTDAGLELSLSLISRQLLRALFEQKDDPWCDLFRRFCINVQEVTNRRGVGGKDGARFAARQIVLTIDGLHEPAFGHQPSEGDPWGDLIARMAQDSELAQVAPLIESVITGKPEIQDWDRDRSNLGLTDELASAIGLGAIPGLEGEEPPELHRGTLE